MFTDMVGYSALSSTDEALSLALLEEHRALLRPLFGPHHGTEVKTIGDAFLVQFDSALDAVQCALAMQRALAARNAEVPIARQVWLRIGLHLGDVVHREGDVYGDGVNIAARVEPLADAGGVVITEDVYRQVTNKVQVPISRLGKGELKNISLPVQVYRLELPGPRTASAGRSRARFLFKQKRVRRAATLVVAGLLALATAALLYAQRRPALPGGRLTLAVADFVNETHDPELDGLSGLLITSLEQSPRLAVLTRSRMLDVLRVRGAGGAARIDEAQAREVAQAERADALVTATLRRFDQVYSLDLKVQDPRRRVYLVTALEKGTGKGSIPDLIDRISQRTREALDETPASLAAGTEVADAATSNLEAYQHFFRGQQLLRELKVTDAIEELRLAVEQDPSYAMAWYTLSYAYFWQQRTDQALSAIQRAVQAASGLGEKDRLLIEAQAALLTGRSQEAQQTYERLLTRFPKEKEALFLLGDFFFHRNEVGQARRYFLRALEIDPLFDLALDHMVQSAEASQDLEAQLSYARRYVAARRSDASLSALARAHLARNELVSARETVASGLEQFPGAHELTRVQAHLLLFDDQVDAALRLYGALPDHTASEGVLHFKTAQALATGGRFQEALATLDPPRPQAERADVVAVARQMRVLFLVSASRSPRELDAAVAALAAQGPNSAAAVVPGLLIHGEVARATALLQGQPDGEVVSLLRTLIDGYQDCASGRREAPAYQALGRLAAHPISNIRLQALFVSAECHAAAGADAEAAALFVAAQREFPSRYTHGVRAVAYPRSLYQLARLQERLGRKEESAQTYRRFLALWASADADHPYLVDARRRLEQLAAAPPR